MGVDAGVKDLIVVADPGGNEVARHRAPRELKRARRKLRALQRKAARQLGPWDATTSTQRQPSTGWRRTQRDIGRAHARVAHLRADRIHKLTTRLSQTHAVIGGETLAVKKMMAAGGARKRGLNRALGDAGLGEVFRQLDYKTRWYGSQMIKADRWFPSSKLCSGCGVVKAKLPLADGPMSATAAGWSSTGTSTQRSTWRVMRNNERTRVPGSSRAEPTVSRHPTVTPVAVKPEPEPK